MTTNERNERNERKYIPEVGARIRLKSMADYHGHSLEAWTTLHAVGVNGDIVVCQRSLTANGKHDGELVNIDLGSVETPIGWKQRYTITATPDQIETVLGWMRDKRGITVRQSHYMPDCSTSFQPSDNDGVHHWKFAGDTVVERVAPEQCVELFRVVKLEIWYDVWIPQTCAKCAGTGLAPATNDFTVNDARHAEQVGYPSGTRLLKGAKINCWQCDKGVSRQYLAAITYRKEKAAVRKELERHGWKLRYEKRGEPCWIGERETVVKEFGADVAEVVSR